MQKKTYGPKEVCKRAEISARQLNYWKLIGVVRPRQEVHGSKIFYRYSDKDLEMILAVKKLTQEGYMVSKAAEKIKAAVANGEEISPELLMDLSRPAGPGGPENPTGLTLPWEPFLIRVEEEIKRSRRFGYSLSCLAFTIDWDTHPGPKALPGFLLEIEKLLMPLKRTFDVVTRRDDHTFIWLLCQTGVPGAEAVTKRIQDSLAAFKGEHNGLFYSAGSRVGIVSLKDREETGESLIQGALKKVERRRK